MNGDISVNIVIYGLIFFIEVSFFIVLVWFYLSQKEIFLNVLFLLPFFPIFQLLLPYREWTLKRVLSMALQMIRFLWWMGFTQALLFHFYAQ